MTNDIVPLDGNAAAGALGSVFAFDVTMAVITCAHCGASGPFAELRLFGSAGAMVLRCRRCDGVNARLLETDRVTNVDFSGILRIQVSRPG